LNWKAFGAMLARDAHVARRNAIQLFFQTFLQPLLFVFIFGRVMVGSGYMPPQYKSLLLPGIIAISMTFTGIWAVAMPLIAEFQWTREIEDRLLAPISINWIAIEKVIAGLLQALVAGLVVLPLGWLVLRPGIDISIGNPLMFALTILLVGGFAACGGLEHEPAAHRTDVQHGDHSNDLFRLHILSLERPQQFSHSAESGPDQSACLRERGYAGNSGSPICPFARSWSCSGFGIFRYFAADRRLAPV
jgi:ABC-type transport system involved in cytochrome c biogenesis permease component